MQTAGAAPDGACDMQTAGRQAGRRQSESNLPNRSSFEKHILCCLLWAALLFVGFALLLRRLL
jgi:hypothetical protein